MKRIVVVGGLGRFGRIAVEQLRRFDLDVRTAARSAAADLRLDAHDRPSLDAVLCEDDIVLDAAGPFCDRSTTLIEAALDLGCDVIDINDDLRYAEAVLALQPRIDRAGNRVLSSASSVSALAAALVRLSGFDEPWRVTAFLAPASRHTSSPGAARSLLRCVGRPVRVLVQGRLQQQLGWSDPRPFSMPPPVGPISGRLFESADVAYLPLIFPSMREVSMHVDTNTPGLNWLLTLAARWPALRSWLERHLQLGTWVARQLGSATGGLGYEIESADGRVARYALVADEKSYLAAIAPAVLAARAIAEDRFPHRGLVLPDRHAEPGELLAFLEAAEIRLAAGQSEDWTRDGSS